MTFAIFLRRFVICSFWILLFPLFPFPRLSPPRRSYLQNISIYIRHFFFVRYFFHHSSPFMSFFFSPQFIHFSNYPLSNDIKQPSSANTVHHYNLIIAVVITPRVPVLSASPPPFFFFYCLIFLLYSTFKRLSAPHMLLCWKGFDANFRRALSTIVAAMTLHFLG